VDIPFPQLTRDLRGPFRGRVALDDLTRGLYATDGSLFQVTPLGVAFPRDADDLAVLVKYCHEHAVPMIPRGAGTGLAGESLGPALVIDLSTHFRRVGEIGPDTVTAEPGVVYAELQAELARHGRRFAPDPASGASCTIGGMVATNASGGNAFRFGYTRDHVVSLDIVWDDGSRGRDAKRSREITRAAADLIRANQPLIAARRPRTPFNRCGYLLHDVLTADGVDLAKLLCGSEGTLGFVTAATLRTVPLAGGTCLALLGFSTFDRAIRAGLELRDLGATGCDLLDRRLLSLTRAGGEMTPVPVSVGAALLITVEADTEREALARAARAVQKLRDHYRLVVLAEPTCDPDGAARIRAARTAAVSGLYALGRGPRPLGFVEDVAVPVEALPDYVTRVQDVLQDFELTGSFLIHVLTGQVHCRPLADLNAPADREKLWPLAEAVHALALSLGGTVSTQHGTGIARTPWVERQYGPLAPVFRELKRVFDPKGLLNPGKIVGPDPSRPAWPLRPRSQESGDGSQEDRSAATRTSPAQPVPGPRNGRGVGEQAGPLPVLVWPSRPPEAEAARCTGCGECRPRGTATRMCPVFRASPTEAATPRAKANLFRLLAGDDLASDAARDVAGLCVNCKMCRDECPAKVNIPKLALEVKAAHQAEHGLDRADWVLARTESFAALGGNLAPFVNAFLGRRSVRWLLETVFGLSRRRRLPAFAVRTFLRRARGRGLTKKRPPGGERVAYFVDVFANYNDPLVGEAAVAVLRHNGVEVYVPPRQRGCGMAPLSQGDVDTAREAAARNVRVLADLVRDGYRIVCSEPTAALALTQDYLDLLSDPTDPTDRDAAVVAANTTELTAYLWERHRAGRLRTDFARLDLTLGHHVPCHVKALRGPAAGPGLLSLIPGLRARTIDVSCSGMAGTWGLAAKNYAASLAAGRPMLDELDRPGVLFGSTECSACRLQMQEGTGKRTLHPVQYLALAYGLLPEIGSMLRRPLGELVSD
jgi:FAD/FMN-containing dehydrogenase/Fe-S oxidoreductase